MADSPPPGGADRPASPLASHFARLFRASALMVARIDKAAGLVPSLAPPAELVEMRAAVDACAAFIAGHATADELKNLSWDIGTFPSGIFPTAASFAALADAAKARSEGPQ